MLSPLLAAILANDWLAMWRLRTSYASCSAEACGGQPDACPVAVPGLGSSRPSRGSQNHTIAFFNAAVHAVQLSWLEGNGSSRPVATIAPGERRQVRTRTGDVWQAHEARDWELYMHETEPAPLLMEYAVGPTLVRDCDCVDAPLTLCPPRGPLRRHNNTEREPVQRRARVYACMPPPTAALLAAARTLPAACQFVRTSAARPTARLSRPVPSRTRLRAGAVGQRRVQPRQRVPLGRRVRDVAHRGGGAPRGAVPPRGQQGANLPGAWCVLCCAVLLAAPRCAVRACCAGGQRASARPVALTPLPPRAMQPPAAAAQPSPGAARELGAVAAAAEGGGGHRSRVRFVRVEQSRGYDCRTIAAAGERFAWRRRRGRVRRVRSVV